MRVPEAPFFGASTGRCAGCAGCAGCGSFSRVDWPPLLSGAPLVAAWSWVLPASVGNVGGTSVPAADEGGSVGCGAVGGGGVVATASDGCGSCCGGGATWAFSPAGGASASPPER